MNDDVERDAGDDETNPWRRPRPAPTSDRLIHWGSPPDEEEQDDDPGPTPTASPSPTTTPPSAPPPPAPAAPLVTAEASPPPTVPAVPRPSQPPPPSSRAPGTFESLAPPVITEEEPTKPAPKLDTEDDAPSQRSWASPTIAASPAHERAMPQRPQPPQPPRPAPRVAPVEPRAERPPTAAAPTSSSTATPASGRPVSITELSHQLTQIQSQLADVARRSTTTPEAKVTDEPRSSSRTDAGLRHLAKQLATVQAQLTGLGEHLGRSTDTTGERRAAERATGAITELSQQLAATQAQVASLSAQLTTLAHRVTYDLERGVQTTTERLVRDLPAAVSPVLAGQLGPAIDDLTDQVEADRAKLTEVVDGLGERLSALVESVEGLPLSNVELMTSIQALEHDLEDRLARLANRLTDQVATLERSNAAELVRVRDHVADLHDLMASPIADAETLDRMAGQVERLSQRAGGGGEVVDALELLIAEHLEVLRDDIEGRVGALAPMVQEELEAMRAEAVAGVGATEEALTERIEALEEALAARIDAALTEQVDGRLEELATATAAVESSVTEQLTGISAALAEVQDAQAKLGEDEAASDDSELVEVLAGINEELQSLRRRITLRLETGDAPAGLSDAQLDDLATRVAAKLRGAAPTPIATPTPAAAPAPRHAAAPRTRPARAAKRA